MKDKTRLFPWLARWFSFYLFFYGIGFGLAIWFGLGWFLLFLSLHRILFAIPRTYFPTITFLFGPEFAEKEKLKRTGRWFTSSAYARSALVFVIFTALAFWKANIPLIQIWEQIR